MKNIVLFDSSPLREQLMPFTYTRPIAAIRCGVFTLKEKWERWLQASASYCTEDYLSSLYPSHFTEDNLYINGALCPDERLIEAVQQLPIGTRLLSTAGVLLALRSEKAVANPLLLEVSGEYVYKEDFTLLRQVWDINGLTGAQIRQDMGLIRRERESVSIQDPHTVVYGAEHIFVEEGATIRAAILNAETGPIYIGRGAEVQEGVTIRGPFALGEGAIVAQGAKIRPNCSVGPYCKVGGELNNAALFGYSNKGHDGYLGSAVLGEWCNLGANTNNSNLKNDFTNVKLHSYASQQLEDTGLTFCGLYMGDYSKAGISTQFNTGTVVGVHVNVFGAGFQPKHIPSFSWGGQAEGLSTYRLEKALQVAEATLARRDQALTEARRAVLEEVFRQTAPQRTYES